MGRNCGPGREKKNEKKKSPPAFSRTVPYNTSSKHRQARASFTLELSALVQRVRRSGSTCMSYLLYVILYVTHLCRSVLGHDGTRVQVPVYQSLFSDVGMGNTLVVGFPQFRPIFPPRHTFQAGRVPCRPFHPAAKR